VTDPNGRVTEYSYDDHGNLTKVRSQVNSTQWAETQYSYGTVLVGAATYRGALIQEKSLIATLPPGQHEITIECTGTKNPAATNCSIGIDAVDRFGADGQFTGRTEQDLLGYNGTWSSNLPGGYASGGSSFGRYEPIGDDPMGDGYEVIVVLDLKLHTIDEITVLHGDPKAVDAPFYDLDVSGWAITEDDIFEYMYADIGRDAIEGFKKPVVTWGGRETGQPDGGPVVIAQCYDESNYAATLHSCFFDPWTGRRIPDCWPTGLQ
jgi:YD repeat-containing protein